MASITISRRILGCLLVILLSQYGNASKSKHLEQIRTSLSRIEKLLTQNEKNCALPIETLYTLIGELSNSIGHNEDSIESEKPHVRKSLINDYLRHLLKKRRKQSFDSSDSDDDDDDDDILNLNAIANTNANTNMNTNINANQHSRRTLSSKLPGILTALSSNLNKNQNFNSNVNTNVNNNKNKGRYDSDESDY